MIIHIVAGGPRNQLPDLKKTNNENIIWVGVDRGVHYLLEENIKPVKAFGDFDSVTETELSHMRKELKEIEIFPSEKDETDTEIAVNWALSKKPDKIKLFGVTGGRLDHFFGNVQLLIKGLQQGTLISIHDKQNVLFLVNKSKHSIVRSSVLPYISFIPITPNVTALTLEGFKYPLKNRNIQWGDTLCISNELDNEIGTFSFKDGILMVIRSRDLSPII
ncbi:thiamine diphosphokinase [Sutcliffiella halmapala]|uniref:thiamine diphosphokinase n=1 Tax=Sutcliffiella halmapala TaxID=79882 RepID=UPI0009955CEA|nr:thiamine diphosphokinase [Sutcliffiella halmapala]